MAKLSKDTVVADVASTADVSKSDTEAVLNAFFDKAASAMRNGDEITWPKFGKFSQGHRSARTGRNPQTGATIDIPAANHPKFTASSALKEAIKG